MFQINRTSEIIVSTENPCLFTLIRSRFFEHISHDKCCAENSVSEPLSLTPYKARAFGTRDNAPSGTKNRTKNPFASLRKLSKRDRERPWTSENQAMPWGGLFKSLLICHCKTLCFTKLHSTRSSMSQWFLSYVVLLLFHFCVFLSRLSEYTLRWREK